jgi:hypothetical protein
MTATLTFTLPEDRAEHLLAVRAREMAADLADADDAMRSFLKHGHQFQDADEAIAHIRGMLSAAILIARGEG